MDEASNITAIVLCGGLGTRLRSVTKDEIPKPMVEVAGKPFLQHLLDDLIQHGVRKVVLAVSYKREVIIDFFGERYKSLAIDYSVETKPLGTGGAIKQALNRVGREDSPVLVLNGDSYCEYNLQGMLQKLEDHPLVIAVRHMQDTSRYGRVEIDSSDTVLSFAEKAEGKKGFINAGIYLLASSIYSMLPERSAFSFENSFLRSSANSQCFKAIITEGDFVDIGVPEDYAKCQKLLSNYEKSPV